MKRPTAAKPVDIGRFKIKNIGDNDQLPYVKADVAKACRVGANFAFSFYQLDYQSLANAASGTSGLALEQTKLVPVVKIVFDIAGFNQFRKEFQAFEAAMKSQVEPKS